MLKTANPRKLSVVLFGMLLFPALPTHTQSCSDNTTDSYSDRSTNC
jgi:hypothetical protein